MSESELIMNLNIQDGIKQLSSTKMSESEPIMNLNIQEGIKQLSLELKRKLYNTTN